MRLVIYSHHVKLETGKLKMESIGKEQLGKKKANKAIFMLEMVEFKVEGTEQKEEDRIKLKSLVNKGDTISIHL